VGRWPGRARPQRRAARAHDRSGRRARDLGRLPRGRDELHHLLRARGRREHAFPRVRERRAERQRALLERPRGCRV
jgi:hypothetical protein